MTSPNPRRACVFCEATDQKISKQHVWPKWLRKVVEGGEGEPIPRSRIHTTSDGTTVRNESWTEAPIDWEVSGPCEPCNNGWMERLETELRPVLAPMVQHESADLDPDKQEILARWATLGVMMAQLGHPVERRRAIRPERYHRFYSPGELPPKAQIWIARCNGEGPWPTNYAHREMFISRPESAGPNAYISAFSVGHVAFVYWGHEVEDGATVHLGERMATFLTPIWPSLERVHWPPVGVLGAKGLEVVVKNLVATA